MSSDKLQDQFPFENLEEHVQELILSFLKPEDILKLGCLNKNLQSWSIDPLTWREQNLEFLMNDYQKMQLCSDFLKQIKNINKITLEYDLCNAHYSKEKCDEHFKQEECKISLSRNCIECKDESLIEKGRQIKEEFIQSVQLLQVNELQWEHDCFINRLPILVPKQLQKLTIYDYPFPKIVNPDKLSDLDFTARIRCKCKKYSQINLEMFQELKQFSNLKNLFLNNVYLYTSNPGLSTLSQLKHLQILYIYSIHVPHIGQSKYQFKNLRRLGVDNYLNPQFGLLNLILPNLESLELGSIHDIYSSVVLQFIEDVKTLRMVYVKTLHVERQIGARSFRNEVEEKMKYLNETREFFRFFVAIPKVPVINFGLNVLHGKCMKKNCTKDKRCHGFFFEDKQ